MSDSAKHSHTEFARKVVQNLLKAVQEAAKEPGSKSFCVAFEGELANVDSHLEKYLDGLGKALSESRIMKLLDTLQNVYQRRSDISKGIFVNQPFLSARFGETNEPSRPNNNAFRSHGFPKLLALGIMLMEIELNVRIEDYRMPDLNSNSQPTVNDEHFAAMNLFRREHLWEEQETFQVVKDVIEMCLVPDRFNPLLNDEKGLRDALKKNIVNSLHALYMPTWGDPETSLIRPARFNHSAISLLRTDESQPRPVSSPVLSVSPQLKPESPEHRFLECSSKPHDYLGSPVTSDDWFAKLDDLSFFLRPKQTDVDDTYTPVRIAILDTGVRYDCRSFVEDFKDFEDPSNLECADNTNHGTNAVFLTKRVYKQARIFVARVFNNSQATSRTPVLMAEAIHHAIQMWKADIIIMPSGFSSENIELERAVDEARNAHVLVFAAASNFGNIEHIAFPGRLYAHLRLFCMFSTDPNVRALPHFNPTPSSRARHSFAILGEGIRLAQDINQSLSGTSFATMIGGALAARILDFARQKEIGKRIRQVYRLHTVEGMSAIFEKMVNGTVDNGYHCMAPWKLLRSEVENQGSASERLLQRKYVRETISRALADMHIS
ncbi:subtilisin-like protein [Penicillium brevicompactum]|uniref:subtilisin-like protein n=1 Tax=Penicillium brevicompactum TaxID=5074 RepID=UPI00254069CD|nr:subtilisin-like protein [Penicillium brevicompactum]KAJ5319506.1 subtilisin-like protein [Penicillium brevicompactum]